MTPTPRQKWTNEGKLIWSLFGVVGALLCILGSILWAQVERNTERLDELSRFVDRADVRLEEMIRRLKAIEGKIDERD